MLVEVCQEALAPSIPCRVRPFPVPKALFVHTHLAASSATLRQLLGASHEVWGELDLSLQVQSTRAKVLAARLVWLSERPGALRQLRVRTHVKPTSTALLESWILSGCLLAHFCLTHNKCMAATPCVRVCVRARERERARCLSAK